uniref:Cleavage/polyadenylation specificity factor A subunit C-terminal domain-containing protein n=1 Tax=Ditylenchus dipsaci TaxID=166011 RepID=A0A915DKP3_9BILA
MQNYLALGTAINYGEEVFVRGRIILSCVRQRAERSSDKYVFCNGYLLTGMGQKVFIWQFRDGELNGVSFLDLHFYVHHLVGFRNLAVACDLYRSLSLLRYQEEYKALSLVSRDLRPSAPTPMAAHFLVDGSHLGFILSDEGGNVTLFNYLPETKESMGGERLIIRASINVGSLINSFVRIKGHVSECLVENEGQARETQTCIFATLDGSFGVQVMTMHVPQPAGLNPKGARSARPVSSNSNQQISSARNIVDGNLVFQYLNLSTQDKMDLARKLGTSRYQILDDLIEIHRTITPY